MSEDFELKPVITDESEPEKKKARRLSNKEFAKLLDWIRVKKFDEHDTNEKIAKYAIAELHFHVTPNNIDNMWSAASVERPWQKGRHYSNNTKKSLESHKLVIEAICKRIGITLPDDWKDG